jgi:hypothetical protein
LKNAALAEKKNERYWWPWQIRDFQVSFKISYVYYYIAKLSEKQVEVIEDDLIQKELKMDKEKPCRRRTRDLNFAVVWLKIVQGTAPSKLLHNLRHNFLLTLASTEILVFRPRRDQWPCFCSLQDHLYVLKLGLHLEEEKGW